MALLRLVYKDDDGRERTIDACDQNSPILVGRNPDCGICTSNGSVSRVHALIRIEDGLVTIQNPPNGKPTNGTFVRGMRLQPDERIEVYEGDCIRCGGFDIYLESEQRTAARNGELIQPPPLVQPLPPLIQPPAPLLQNLINSANNRGMAPVYGPRPQFIPQAPPRPVPPMNVSMPEQVGYGPPPGINNAVWAGVPQQRSNPMAPGQFQELDHSNSCGVNPLNQPSESIPSPASQPAAEVQAHNNKSFESLSEMDGYEKIVSSSFQLSPEHQSVLKSRVQSMEEKLQALKKEAEALKNSISNLKNYDPSDL